MRQVIRSQGSKGARSFRGQKIPKPGHRMHFFPKKKLTTFLVVALKTGANAADRFTVKNKTNKAVRYGNMFTVVVEGAEWDGKWGEGISLDLQPTGVWGSVVGSPAGSGAEPQPKTILVLSGGARTAPVAILVANFAFFSQGLRLEAEPSPTWM